MSVPKEETLVPAALQFAADEKMAAGRSRRFRDTDPFKTIPAALLNSADIYDYVRATSMIWPFNNDEKVLREKLKGASYEVDFLGDVYSYPDDAIEPRKVSIQPKNNART